MVPKHRFDAERLASWASSLWRTPVFSRSVPLPTLIADYPTPTTQECA